MLINLVPDFLAVLADADPVAAWQRYFDSHNAVLTAYWRNYVLEPGSPAATEVVRHTLAADRSDLHALLAGVDVVHIVEETLARAEEVLQVDRPTDVYLMIGMGGANAGELVVGGRGAAFICLEHFTGRANPQTYGLGLTPDLIPLWVAHGLAHTVRYTSPASRSDLRRLVSDSGGYYDYWETGRRATLRELLVNEGLAVRAAEAVTPGFRLSDYFGYTRRQYHRLRELEAFLNRAVTPDLDRSALGLRLRYLSGGMSPSARLVQGKVVPERSGYYLGHRMTEALVRQHGIASALRAPSGDVQAADEAARGVA
ncbi:MAG TPA: DUF2268 domain-containing putative Zn-dependent protease [Gemmatimonadales bacterium]|nr:DUF2268 domain-containing putative Zn-dependent protease [Gemmatimonadales bacterium]